LLIFSRTAGDRAPCINELLPLPLTPVSTVKRPSGIATSTFFKLFAVAPVTRSQPSFDLSAGSARRSPRDRMFERFVQALPVTLFLFFNR
jgi:hypothetical protein